MCYGTVEEWQIELSTDNGYWGDGNSWDGQNAVLV